MDQLESVSPSSSLASFATVDAADRGGRTGGLEPADISVVIPAINEQDSIATSIGSALRAGAVEVIVADGGSSDDTFRRAIQSGATKVVRSLPGRGIQLNSGAMFAKRRFVLFLHADNQLDASCLQQICDHSHAVWGAFSQRIDSSRPIFRLLEWGNAMRVKLRRAPFGDQAMFVRRDLFNEQGGFAEIPLMEDVELSKRLRKISRPLLLDGPVTINARRWQQRGVIRQTLQNWSIQVSFAMGSSPKTLNKRYR
jgi:rSAM/selenodomain-associated transferase 2